MVRGRLATVIVSLGRGCVLPRIAACFQLPGATGPLVLADSASLRPAPELRSASRNKQMPRWCCGHSVRFKPEALTI